MSLFRFKQYSYKPSFEAQNKAKNIELTEKYEKVFLKTIEKEKLSKEEQNLLLNGINDLKTYIVNAIFYKMTEQYSSKTPIEKKLETLFNKNLKIESLEKIKEELLEIATDSIYYALGFSESKEFFKKENNNSYFLKYVQSVLFYKVLNYLEETVNNINHSIENYYNEEEDISEDVDNLLRMANFDKSLPSDIYNELRENLLKKECPKHLIPYYEYILSLRLSI